MPEWLIALAVLLVIIKLYSTITCGLCPTERKIPGKVVIVTGANTGIGYETARDLARRGARVILACRNIDKGIKAREQIIKDSGNDEIFFMHLDLACNDSVHRFVTEFRNSESRLDILVNNAGCAALGHIITDDGVELELQINYYGPYLLTNLLLPMLKKSAPSRIINVSSFSHWTAIPSVSWLNSYLPIVGMVYANSKFCNILFTKELSRKLKGTGVTANSLHPGLVKSDIYRNTNFLLRFITSMYNKWLFKSAWEGAQTSIYLAVAPELDEVSGVYFTDCKPGWESPMANNRQLAKELWDHSERVVELDKWLKYNRNRTTR